MQLLDNKYIREICVYITWTTAGIAKKDRIQYNVKLL